MDKQAERQIEIWTNKRTDRKMDKQAERQIERWTNKQKDR